MVCGRFLNTLERCHVTVTHQLDEQRYKFQGMVVVVNEIVVLPFNVFTNVRVKLNNYFSEKLQNISSCQRVKLVFKQKFN